MTPMTTLTYTVRFLTPAFLGDAEQTGRWRTMAGWHPAPPSISGFLGPSGNHCNDLFDDLGMQDAAGMKREDDPLRALGVNSMAALRAEHGKSGLQQHGLRFRCRQPGSLGTANLDRRGQYFAAQERGAFFFGQRVNNVSRLDRSDRNQYFGAQAKR